MHNKLYADPGPLTAREGVDVVQFVIQAHVGGSMGGVGPNLDAGCPAHEVTRQTGPPESPVQSYNMDEWQFVSRTVFGHMPVSNSIMGDFPIAS